MRTKLELPLPVDGLAAAALGLFAFVILGVRQDNAALAAAAGRPSASTRPDDR